MWLRSAALLKATRAQQLQTVQLTLASYLTSVLRTPLVLDRARYPILLTVGETLRNPTSSLVMNLTVNANPVTVIPPYRWIGWTEFTVSEGVNKIVPPLGNGTEIVVRIF